MVTNVKPYNDQADFFKALKVAIEHNNTHELLLYLHGYNNGFNTAMTAAACVAAETQHSTKGPRVVLAFDWASQNRLSLYGYVPWENDLIRARAAGPKLAQLLADLATSNAVRLLALEARTLATPGAMSPMLP